MRYVKWTVIGLVIAAVAAFLSYTLPDREVIRIVGTDTRRIDFGENSWFWAAPDVGTGAAASRDVKFIEAVKPNGRVVVYRNEDTGWGWPPYFKFNSYNLQAQATNLISTEAAPRWVVVTHYGWRSEFLTIFPNAVALREVASPDVPLFPWVNIVILVAIALVVFLIWRMIAQFRERVLDPAADRVARAFDAADARADAAGRRARGFWRRLFGR